MRHFDRYKFFVATCPPLSVSNGIVGYTTQPIGTGANRDRYVAGTRSYHGRYIEGTTADFTCYDGYSRSGPRTRHCTSSKTWDGRSPTCVKGNDTNFITLLVFAISKIFFSILCTKIL